MHTDQPVIWVYPGNPRNVPGFNSPFDSVVILHACIEVLKDLPVQVILSTGNQTLPKSVLPLPSNFRYAFFVPALAMAERSDLMIHHGGYGSCQTGLYCGTPAIIIPTYSERESNARRIAALGAGDLVIPKTDASRRKKEVDNEELRTKVIKVLSSSSYKDKAMQMSKIIRSYGGQAKAADLIENFMNTPFEG